MKKAITAFAKHLATLKYPMDVAQAYANIRNGEPKTEEEKAYYKEWYKNINGWEEADAALLKKVYENMPDKQEHLFYCELKARGVDLVLRHDEDPEKAKYLKRPKLEKSVKIINKPK